MVNQELDRGSRPLHPNVAAQRAAVFTTESGNGNLLPARGGALLVQLMRVLHLNCKGSNFIAARTQKDDKLNLAKLRRGSQLERGTAPAQTAQEGVS